MLKSLDPLMLMARRLGDCSPLDAADTAAILALPFTRRLIPAGQVLVWDGDAPTDSCILLNGFAFRHKSAGSGGRQILSIHMKGDIVDLQNALLPHSDHNVQMLTEGEVAYIPIAAIRALALHHPRVGMAMWHETLVEGSIFREWILNIGRRDAYARIAHLLCEFSLRLQRAELGRQQEYELPISQDQLADAVSLTPVHVNRTLMRLEEEGLIARDRRAIRIHDWRALATVADFNPDYLHLPSNAVQTLSLAS